jgi:hypothetical protein
MDPARLLTFQDTDIVLIPGLDDMGQKGVQTTLSLLHTEDVILKGQG